MSDQLTVRPVNQLNGEITIPGDKSISHRSVLIGSIARGTTRITNFLRGEDCLSTIKCMRALGVTIEDNNNAITVKGNGKFLKAPAEKLDAGNSGTTVRLLMGILAGQNFPSTLIGDDSLSSRPMLRVTEPLRLMGAKLEGKDGGDKIPITVTGGSLKSITYKMPVASAQVKSAILLAALYANDTTTIIDPCPSRNHTELMLKQFGASVNTTKSQSGADNPDIIRLNPESTLHGCNIYVPGDISSAAFFMVAAAVISGSKVLLRNVGINPTRTGIIEVLKDMGADISITEVEGNSSGQSTTDFEPIADILVRGGKQLKAVTVGGSLIPRLIDEIPAIAAAALFAEGRTVIKDAAELRVKESDRIMILACQLSMMGADIKEQPDGFVIEGGKPLKGCVCESNGDHRMAMTLAIAALKAFGETTIKDVGCIEISYPSFRDDLNKLKD